MAYNLGKVAPGVASVANTLGARHGIKTAYGYRAVGSVPGSDHPKGLAVDFMINDLPNGRAVGDDLAADAIANYQALGIKYVIWYRRIWQPGIGWKRYVGPSPHTDHVHVSWNPNPSGIKGDLISVGLPNPIDDAKRVWDFLSKVNDAAGWLTDAGNWRRIGVFTAGMTLILIALIGFKNAATAVKKVGSYAKS